jgi:hypothetical protein
MHIRWCFFPKPHHGSFRGFIHLHKPALPRGSLKRLQFLHGPFLPCLFVAGLLDRFLEQFPSRKTPPQLPNFHSERLSIRCGRPGRRKLFRLVVFLQFSLACAELPERAARQIPDGWSQSKLLATIYLWISRGGHFSMESSLDKRPREPLIGSGVCSGVRMRSWLPCRGPTFGGGPLFFARKQNAFAGDLFLFSKEQ